MSRTYRQRPGMYASMESDGTKNKMSFGKGFYLDIMEKEDLYKSESIDRWIQKSNTCPTYWKVKKEHRKIEIGRKRGRDKRSLMRSNLANDYNFIKYLPDDYNCKTYNTWAWI